jgi:hypothetical protein
MFNQEEELIIAEDKDDETIRISDDDSAHEYETLRISTTGDVMHLAMKLLARKSVKFNLVTVFF